METLPSILLMLFVVFALARTFSAVVEKFGFPGLIGEIVLGILMANVVINETSLVTLLDLGAGTNNNSILYTFSEL